MEKDCKYCIHYGVFSLTCGRCDDELTQYERKSCNNCANQIEPLRMCKWAEQGGDGVVHYICPKWERKD